MRLSCIYCTKFLFISCILFNWEDVYLKCFLQGGTQWKIFNVFSEKSYICLSFDSSQVNEWYVLNNEWKEWNTEVHISIIAEDIHTGIWPSQ